MAPPQSEAFQKAVVDSKKLTSKPGNEELLDLYGTDILSLLPGSSCSSPRLTSKSPAALFKVSSGEDITKAPAPGMFDLKVRRDVASRKRSSC